MEKATTRDRQVGWGVGWFIRWLVGCPMQDPYSRCTNASAQYSLKNFTQPTGVCVSILTLPLPALIASGLQYVCLGFVVNMLNKPTYWLGSSLNWQFPQQFSLTPTHCFWQPWSLMSQSSVLLTLPLCDLSKCQTTLPHSSQGGRVSFLSTCGHFYNREVNWNR